MSGVLWRDRDFAKFWGGQTVSLFGSQVTLLALPLTAALTLGAAPAQMGILGAAQFAPGLVVGLAAGPWLDRARRRPALVASQVVNMLALGWVPVAAHLGLLRIEQLYAVALLTGAANTVASVAQNAYLPFLAGRENLVEANSDFQASRTLAQILGPGIAGILVQAVTAPLAIALDAISFLFGAVTAAWIGRSEDLPGAGLARRHPVREATEGMTILWRDPLLRSVTLTILLANIGGNMTAAVFVLLFVDRLGLSPAQLGFAFAAGGVSSLVGTRLARPLVARYGVGPVMVVATGVFATGLLATIAAAFAHGPAVFWLLAGSNVVAGLGLMVYNVNQMVIRQAVVPGHLLGRAGAGVLVIVYTGQVGGSILGGVLGQHAGLRVTLIAGSVVAAANFLPALFSPLRRMHDLPGTAPGP